MGRVTFFGARLDEWTAIPLAEAQASADPDCTSCRGTGVAWEHPRNEFLPAHKAICRCAGGSCFRLSATG